MTTYYPTWGEASRHVSHGHEVKMGPNGKGQQMYYVAAKEYTCDKCGKNLWESERKAHDFSHSGDEIDYGRDYSHLHATGNIATVIAVWDDIEGNSQTLARTSAGPSDFDEAEVWGMMIVRDFFEGIIPMGTVTTVKFQGNEVTYKVLDRK